MAEQKSKQKPKFMLCFVTQVSCKSVFRWSPVEFSEGQLVCSQHIKWLPPACPAKKSEGGAEQIRCWEEDGSLKWTQCVCVCVCFIQKNHCVVFVHCEALNGVFSSCLPSSVCLPPPPPLLYRKSLLELQSKALVEYKVWSHACATLGCNVSYTPHYGWVQRKEQLMTWKLLKFED